MVGSDATVLHWDGVSWTTMPSGTWQWIRGIWGISNRELFAVAASTGGYGAVLHFDGERWSELISNAGPALTGIWGAAGGELWACGAGATVLRRK